MILIKTIYIEIKDNYIIDKAASGYYVPSKKQKNELRIHLLFLFLNYLYQVDASFFFGLLLIVSLLH